jgi:hypothetical protein
MYCVENQLCVVLVARVHQFQEAKGPETKNQLRKAAHGSSTSISGCQEKYFRELSSHSRAGGVPHRSYRKSVLWGGIPQELFFCMAKMRYFRATGMIFPRLPLPRQNHKSTQLTFLHQQEYQT